MNRVDHAGPSPASSPRAGSPQVDLAKAPDRGSACNTLSPASLVGGCPGVQRSQRARVEERRA